MNKKLKNQIQNMTKSDLVKLHAEAKREQHQNSKSPDITNLVKEIKKLEKGTRTTKEFKIDGKMEVSYELRWLEGGPGDEEDL